MPEDRYWVIKCKICGKFHRADPVISPGIYQPSAIPAYATVECPDPEHKGKTADYFGSDWLIMTPEDFESRN